MSKKYIILNPSLRWYVYKNMFLVYNPIMTKIIITNEYVVYYLKSIDKDDITVHFNKYKKKYRKEINNVEYVYNNIAKLCINNSWIKFQ